LYQALKSSDWDVREGCFAMTPQGSRWRPAVADGVSQAARRTLVMSFTTRSGGT